MSSYIWYSHLTQKMLNYFDEADVRVRQNKYTIDAQLINSFAQAIELNDLKINREINARSLTNCPFNIDNGGVYTQFKIPANSGVPTDVNGNIIEPSSVEGLSGTNWITLSKYDDILPSPYRVEVDVNTPVVPLPNPILLTIDGTGIPQTLALNMPVPNKLTFWLDHLSGADVAVQIRVTGEIFSETVWVSEDAPHGEEIMLVDEGPSQSKLVWQSVSSITVHGLPAGARLRVYGLPFGLDGVPDQMRPYHDYNWRGLVFPRYWTIDGQLIKEVYVRNRFAGFEYAQSYLSNEIPTAIAVEPNTYGLFVATNNRLYYADRREPMPLLDYLTQTGISVEPLYGLVCGHDTSHTGSVRYLHIAATPYAGASNLVRYRYLLMDHFGVVYALDSNGYLLEYHSSAGWRPGPPTTVNVPLTQTGTYVVTLETMDTNNVITRDYYPFSNLEFYPLADLDMTTIVPEVKGLAFDSKHQLWVWTGSFAVPLKLHYDGYVIDTNSQSVYLTDEYSQVRLNYV